MSIAEASAQRSYDLMPQSAMRVEASVEHRKRFGQFLTPWNAALLMADWVVGGNPTHILDPAFGTGILVSACREKGSNAAFSAYEIDPLILEQSPQLVKQRVRIHQRNFLESDISDTYDGLIMNPPYIRHRELSGHEHIRQRISLVTSCIVPRSANLYIYFSLYALHGLKTGGRAALLIPSEWMSANFSRSFKEYLLKKDLLSEIVMFSDCRTIFSDALTTACVLLCQKK